MCGICGVVSTQATRITQDQLEAMSQTFAYRGPDDDGVHISACPSDAGRQWYAGLAHRRLSIIDLSDAGHQPMCNEDGTIWITYNGEIYNHRSLREELTAKGHVFRSHTDTEVIIHLYEEEETEAVKRLNGMFAFAIWDMRIGRLWLCRDRLGVKPLVYALNGETIAFGSEIKALLALEWIPKEIDAEALQLYTAFSYVPSPLTIFKSIRKLPPGHSLLFDQGAIMIDRYWSIPEHADTDYERLSYGEAYSQIMPRIVETLETAVTDRMIADVPLGAFLSGGIDSSIIVALMARNASERIKTFSIGFTGDALFDETRYARDVARMYRTDHHEFKLDAGDMKTVLEDVLSAFDEPFSDSSAIPTFIVSRETRQHVTVALSGDGGDELFAGYRSYLAWYWYERYMRVPEPIRRSFFECIIEQLPGGRDSKSIEFVRRIQKFIDGTKGTALERMLRLKEIGPEELRHRLLPPSNGAGDTAPNDIAHLKQFMEAHPGDPINRALYADTLDSLPGDMLTKVDWMSMLNSLEVRVPFLDYRMVELAFSIPGRLKMKRGVTKSLLKEAFRPMLPKSLYKRPKAGFEIPISRWLRTDMGYLIDQYLDTHRLRRQAIFDAEVVKETVDSFRTGRHDHSWVIWNLVVFQAWYDQYFS